MNGAVAEKPALVITDQPVVGRMLIKAVASLGYSKGYNSIVEDEYEPVFQGHNAEPFWGFVRRVQRFYRADHGDQHCDECAAWWERIPDMPDKVLFRSKGW